MNKILKYGLIALVGVGGLFVLLLFVASLAIDPNDYKPQIVQLVKAKTQRTLSLAGRIELAYFPRLGLDLGRVSLSEYRGEKEFAAVESVRLYLSWWPLLRKELVVDQVRIEGVRADLLRFKDGTTNFDDLLKQDDAESKRIKFDIDSVKVDKSALSFRDELAGRQFSLSEIEIATGRLANAKATEARADFKLRSDSPQIDAQVHVTTGLTFDTEANRYAVKGLNLEIRGEAAGLREFAVGLKGNLALDRTAGTLLAEHLAVAVAGKKGADDVDVRLIAPRLQWGADKVAAEKIELVAKVKPRAGGDIGLVATIPAIVGSGQSFKVDGLSVEVNAEQRGARYRGNFSSSLSGDLRRKQFTLPDLKGNLAVSDKKMLAGEVKLDIAGTAQFDLAYPEAKLNVISRLDESNIKIKAGASPLTHPQVSLDIDIDRIDADRYLPAKTQQAQTRAETPFDFSSLTTLDASGSLRIGSLKLYNIKSSKVRLDFNTMVGDTVKPEVETRAANQPTAGLKGRFR